MFLNVAKCNLGKVYLERMCPAVSMPVAWPQGLASPCASMWALIAITALVCCADLCDRYLGPITALVTIFAICLLSWALWITAFSAYLPIQRPALPTPHRKWFIVGFGSGKFLRWGSFTFSVTVLADGHLRDWFPLTGLPWNLPAVSHQSWMAPVPKLINWRWV